MKTKEIKVWVHKNLLGDSWGGHAFAVVDSEEPNSVKARLIIDIPEKKIELSESQFDKYFIDYQFDMIDLCVVKQKLFGDKA